jgi:hypothetical protein
MIQAWKGGIHHDLGTGVNVVCRQDGKRIQEPLILEKTATPIVWY